MSLVRQVLLRLLHLALLLALLLGLGAAGAAQTQAPLVLTQDHKVVSTAGQLAFLKDEQARLSFEQARQARFVPLAAQRSGGYSAAAHWYRLSLVLGPQTSGQWILALGEAYLDDVRVWVVSPDQQVTEHQLGDHFWPTRPALRSPGMALVLDLSEQGPTEVFVRIESISALNFNARLWQTDAFFSHEGRVNFYQGLYFGVLLIFVLINLLFGVWLKDTSMLAFAGYAGTLVLLFLGINGYVPMLLPWAPPWLVDGVTGLGVVAGMTAAVLLWSQLLELGKRYPRINKAYWLLALLCMAAAPLVASDAYRIVAPNLFRISIIYMFITLVLVGLLWHRNKKLEFLFYLMAVLANVTGAFTQITMSLGWLPLTALTEYAHQGLSLVQALLMTLGLLIRIGELQSERVRMEQAVTLANERNEEQRRFVAVLSHEFRTPLAVVDRAAQMVLFNTPQLAAAQVERMHTIRSAVGGLSTLVDGFLATEKIRHNKLQLQIENCALESFFQAQLGQLGEDLSARVQCDIALAQPSWPIDPEMLGMAVRNLLINALRYSPSSSLVTLQARSDPTGLTIEVSDHGPGLQAQELSQLGEPYYRASSSSGKQGTGLGYHFSKQIVSAHGGQMHARNHDSGGLVVTIELLTPSA